MNLALISDTHGQLPDPSLFAGADLILHAGDVGPDVQVPTWITHTLTPWIHRLREGMGIPCYATLGNHDMLSHWAGTGDLGIMVDGHIAVGCQRVWFSPWSPTFGDWAWMRSEDELARIYAQIPEDTTIIVSHSPPYQLADKTFREVHAGSQALRARMQELPQLTHLICGHIHEARGVTQLGTVHILNVASLDDQYVMHPDPITWLTVNEEVC